MPLQNRSFSPAFWRWHLALPLLLAVLLIFLYPITGLDAWLIQPFYDAHALNFPLKQNSFLENFMHQGLKSLMISVSLVALGLWLYGFKRSNSVESTPHHLHWSHVYHRQFLWLFVGMVISTSAISILKHLSNHACPWDLLAYGGTQPLIPLFGNLPIGAIAGHCFPGGHASGGFALMAFYFAFKDSAPKIAKLGLMLGLLFGFAMGWGQMMRGAHFMSHNLWTAWIVWMLLLAQYLVWSPKAISRKT